jgi:signal recognition particle receptor subunit beta
VLVGATVVVVVVVGATRLLDEALSAEVLTMGMAEEATTVDEVVAATVEDEEDAAALDVEEATAAELVVSIESMKMSASERYMSRVREGAEG